MSDQPLSVIPLLHALASTGGSDLHVKVGSAPRVRVDGRLRKLQVPELRPKDTEHMVAEVLPEDLVDEFRTTHEADFAFSVSGVGRFRVNAFQARGTFGLVFRRVSVGAQSLAELGLPEVVGELALEPRGLVLVTGPTGSGKSTTLASIVDLANRSREDHIVTVEDPIEFLHRHKKCIVNQREVGQDTWSFANALKHVLRQDPDIILIGEMRDLETISVALTAAETGHLVFATLHTQDAAQTIDRIIDVFPAEQQGQVRTQLAASIQGVVCQTLCKRQHGAGRVVATEVLIATPAIRNLIREGKTHQIYSSMQAGSKQGMHTLDQHLADLVRTGKITYEVGMEKCHHVEDFNRLTGRTTSMNQGAAMLDASLPAALGGHR